MEKNGKKLLSALKKYLLLVLCLYSFNSFGQTEQRIKFTSVTSSVNTGQDYSPWLNDDLTSLVQNVWQSNLVWVDLTLKLTQHSIITRLSFYDYEGVFTDKPDSIYALNGTKRTFLCTFTGPSYMVWDQVKLKIPAEADALIIHKYGNNIPQKVDIFGVPYSAIPSNISTLSKLTLSSGGKVYPVLTPVFSATTTAYTASVDNTINTINLTPTLTDIRGTVTVNGVAVQSGAPSANIPLVVGSNTINTVVTAQDGTTTKTYTITVNRGASSNAVLARLTLSSGLVSPVFASTTTVYTAAVSYVTSAVRITPTAGDPKATITINGNTIASGATTANLPLVVGPNSFTIVVTAPDGKTTKTYGLTVSRAAVSTNAGLSDIDLSNGSLTPVFATATTSYQAYVNNTVSAITLTPTTSDATAHVKVNDVAVTSGSASTSIPLAVGVNTVRIVVTAQDGKTIKKYAINVVRAVASTNANLSKLTLSSGILSPVFAANTTIYTTSVTNITSSVKITPTSSDVAATISVNNQTVATGTASSSISLTVGANTIKVAVLASDGKTIKTYTVVVTRAVSTDATLASLILSNVTLSPAFSSTTIAYATSVSSGTSSIKVMPTPDDSTATVKVNGIAVPLHGSATVPLSIGSNIISTVVIAPDNKTTKTYTTVITRAAASINANLANLELSAGTLSPTFVSNTTTYSTLVNFATTSIVVTPTASSASSTVKVNGISIASGDDSAGIPLAVGDNTITTLVTAQDGTTTKTYTLTITRVGASTNANLASLALSNSSVTPTFSANTILYATSVSNTTTSITVTPTVSVSTSTVQVNGKAVTSGNSSSSMPLVVGSNTITTMVTAQDGVTTKSYKLMVTRAVSTNANLSNLVLSSGTLSPAFSAGTLSYTASVPNATSSITVTPTANVDGSTIQVNGTSVASGSPSINLSLAVGSNTIKTVVTAQNGTTTITYNVVITRAGATQDPPPVVTSNPGSLPDTGNLVKIPIDSTRWYFLTNISNSLGALTDGNLTGLVNTGYGLVITNYDAYYPVLPGEQIDLYAMRFYSNSGNGFGNYPLTISVIDSTGTRTVVGTYVGGVYQAWLGPTPGSSSLAISKPMKNIRYIVLNCWYQFPNEMELYGYYKAPTAIAPLVKKTYPLGQYFGANAFEWNFEDPNNPTVVSTTMLAAMKSFTEVRHYMDWSKLETTQGNFTFNPVHSGGWNYDAMYQACKSNNMLVLADLKTMPAWMISTYPADIQDDENIPVPYGSDITDPNSYILQAKVAFQYAARYGSNANVSSALLSVDPTTRWTGDPANTVKKDMALIKYIECDNERDKWWKGRKAYQTSYEYAANMSAFYDGNKNTMGPGVGVKNADPNMLVVMGGLASADPTYVHGMIEWCKQHRGYNADGTVNLCWDVINYHLYNNNSDPQGYATTGVAPEVSIAAQKAADFVQVAHQYANDMQVWVTESGYDSNQGSIQKAPPIGNKTSAQVEGDWILRTSLLYARTGVARVFYYEAYDDNPANPTQYSSSGLLNNDFSRRPATDYMLQVNKIFGNYSYQQTISASPLVDKYQMDSLTAYVLTMPTQSGKTGTYTLNLTNADSAYIYTPVIGASDMSVSKVKITNGTLAVNVSETPIFVLPAGLPTGTSFAKRINVPETPTFDSAITVYPNPTSKYATIALNNKTTGDVTIKVTDVNMGKVYATYTGSKGSNLFSQTIDISNVPMGVCIVQVLQNGEKAVKKVIKTY